MRMMRVHRGGLGRPRRVLTLLSLPLPGIAPVGTGEIDDLGRMMDRHVGRKWTSREEGHALVAVGHDGLNLACSVSRRA